MMSANPLRVLTKVTKLSRIITMMTNGDHGAPERLDGHFQSLNHYQPAGADDDNDPPGVLTTNTKRANTLDTMLILPSRV